MKRWLFNMLVAVLAILCVAFLIQWPASYLFRRWFAVRRADVTYNVVSNLGWITLQRAHLQYPPAAQGWNYAHGVCMNDDYGPASPTSFFEHVALIDAEILIPWDVDPSMGASAVACSIGATGRSISIPGWALAAITGYLPLSVTIRRIRQRREKRRRGFDVTTSSGEQPVR